MSANNSSILQGFDDGYITPEYLKTLLSKSFNAYTTSEEFQKAELSKEELIKTRVAMNRLIDFLDTIK